MKKICLFLFLLCSIPMVFAQEALNLDGAKNVFEQDKILKEWLKKQPEDAKNWKWIARYNYDLLNRVDENGHLPSNEVFLDSYNDFQKLKTEQSINARTKALPDWSPAGPYGKSSFFGIGRVNCIAFHPKDSLVYYLGFGKGGIWKTTNGGKSYTPMGDQLPITRISHIAIDPNNTEILYISIGDFSYASSDILANPEKSNAFYGLGVYKSIDGGKNWKPTGLNQVAPEYTNSVFRTIWVNPKNSKEVVVGGYRGIFKSTDGGDTFEKVYDKFTGTIQQNPENSDILYASGCYIASKGEAGIFKSIDAGKTWQVLNTGIPIRNAYRVELAISPTNPNYIYAIASDNLGGMQGFYRSFDAGVTWSKSKFTGNILNSTMTSEGGQGSYDLCILVHPTDPKKVYVGGLVIAETSDTGDNWIYSTGYSTIHPDQQYFAFNQLNKTFYLCNDGGLFSTKNIIPNTSQNLSWKLICDGINTTEFYRLGVSEDGKDILAGAQDNGTFYQRSNDWGRATGGDGMEAAFAGDWLYTSSQNGNIYGLPKSGGSSFSVFPPTDKSDLGEWTTPFVVSKSKNAVFIGGGHIYQIPIGSQRNFLTKLSNFGNETNSTMPSLCTALAICKNDQNTLYAAKRSGTFGGTKLWKTSNGGTAWTGLNGVNFANNAITYITVDDNDANRIWVSMSGFKVNDKIYHSIDGGQTWENMSYNLPNLPVNCSAYFSDKNTDIVYVGMDIGVYYLVEGTKEWKLLIGNLPNVMIREFEIHAESRQLYAATFGRGIWKVDLLTGETPSNESFYDMNVVLYPNANKGNFTIKTDYEELDKIEIVNGLGVTVYSEVLKTKALKHGKYFSLTKQLENGLYYVRIIQGNRSKIVRMFVEK